MDPVKYNEKPEVKLHFLDYWRVIRLRKSLILTVFLLVVLTTTAVTFWLLPEKYASFVRIEVNKESPEISLGYESHQISNFDPYFLQTQFEILKSSELLNRVIETNNLEQFYTKQLNMDRPLTREETYYLLHKRVSIQQTRGTSLIEIWVKDSDKGMAAQIANSIGEIYASSRREVWEMTRQAAIEKLKTSLNEQSNKVEVLKKRVSDLRIKGDIALIGETDYTTSTVENERIRQIESLRLQAYDSYTHSFNTLRHILELQKSGDIASSIATFLSNDLELSALADRYNQAELTFLSVSNTVGSAHPDYKDADSRREMAKRMFDKKLKGVIDAFQSRVDIDKEHYEKLDADLAKVTKDNTERARDMRPFLDAKRDLENEQLMLEYLNKKVLSEEIEKTMPLSLIVRVHDTARPALKAVSPNKPVNIGLGILIGLIVGVGLAFFIEYLDTSVKTIDDVERSLEAPVLAVIPQQVGVLLDEGIDSPHAEAYRVLRTNLLFARKDESWNTVTVLSGGAGEGKSTTLFNLATVFAQNGSRVLVVDSDLNRPSIHKMLHVANSPGLTDHLLKQVKIEDLIQTTQQENLHFLPSGKLPRASMGILGSVQMKEVIKDLKRRYDFVFFDSPPLLGVSDASVLASQMDMTLQVIQYRRYPQLMTIRAKQMILKVGGHLMGIVLNNINMSQDENYYYYSGYYEYKSKQKGGDEVKGKGDAADKAAKGDAKKQSDGEIKQKY